MGSEVIIKTTATYQDADEMNKQRPIIQFDGNLVSQKHENYRSNLVRASIDSGRDNPFRPDGEIYKSADPIVDYYKFGPNQSRTQSPTDSQLLLNLGKDGKLSKKEKKKAKKEQQRRAKLNNNNNEQKTATSGQQGPGKRSCLRRWLCCCCDCFTSKCCKSKKATSELQNESDNPKTISEAVARHEQRVTSGAALAPVDKTKETAEQQKVLSKPKIVILNTPDEADEPEPRNQRQQPDQVSNGATGGQTDAEAKSTVIDD